MRRLVIVPAILSLALSTVPAGSQVEAGIQGRIRKAPLSEERRAMVLQAVPARDYPQIESALTPPPDAPPDQAAGILALLGALEFVGGRMQQAIGAFQRADTLQPLDQRDRFTYAMALANRGDAKNSRDQLERLTQLHPEQPLYLYWLARIDYYERRYEEAAARLERVTRLDPGSARAWDNLGLTYDMRGESDKAQRAFQEAVALNRRLPSPSAWPPMNFGSLLFRLEKLPEAEVSLREALRYNPESAQAHYFLGRVLERAGRDTEAVSELRNAARLATGMAEPLYSLSLLYRRLGRLAEANQALEQYKQRRDASSPAPATVFGPDLP